MRINAQKIRSGLNHLKQMMSHSGLPASPNINRNSFGASMENPLGSGPIPANSSGGSQNRHARHGNGGLRSPYQVSPAPNVVPPPVPVPNVGQRSHYQVSPAIPRSPYQASPVPQVPAQTNFYGRSPGNQSNHDRLEPLVQVLQSNGIHALQGHGPVTNFYFTGNDSNSNGNVSKLYSKDGKQEIVNKAPPPTLLTGLQQAQTEFYQNQTDLEVNQTLDHHLEETMEGNSNGNAEKVMGPLAIQKDLKLYEDFLKLHEYHSGLPDSLPGLKSLANGDYEMEKVSPWHKSAHLMELLIMYYKKHHQTKKLPISFSQFITGLSVADLEKIWEAPNDGYAKEYLRRFIQGVRYLTPEKAEKYNVYIKGSTLFWAKWGDSQPLDTTTEDFYKRKHEETPYLVQDVIAIWVLSKEDKLYTHPAKVHRFHHSSFTSGDLIRCAGDWEVQNGKLNWISARSGHYMPGFDFFRSAVSIMANKFGINANSFDIRIFEPGSQKKEVFIKARELLYNFEKIRDNYILA